MPENEFIRIKTDEILIRTEDWLKGYERLKGQIENLRRRFPTQETPDTIVIDVDLFDRREDPKTERRRRQVSQQITALEQTEVPQLYQYVTQRSNIYLGEHHRQQQSFSCTLASSLNALEALGQRGDLTEEDLAQMVGETGMDSPIVLQKALNALTALGLKVEHVLSAVDVVKRLEEDQVVMMTDYSGSVAHEVLLSGVDIEQGKITVRLNDPLEHEATNVPFAEIAAKIEYEIPNAYAISTADEKRAQEIEIRLIDK